MGLARVITERRWSVTSNALQANSVDAQPNQVKLTVKQPGTRDSRSMVPAAEIVISVDELTDFLEALQVQLLQNAKLEAKR